MALSYTLPAFLLFTAAICLAEIPSLRTTIGHRVTELSTQVDYRHEGYRRAPGSSGSGGIESDLLDIVLVASVDGKLHALNRTSGESIWSMASSAGTVPTTLGPLVRTQHPEIDYDMMDDDSVYQEVYVIEPQSGDIYVMSSPDGPLQRLPVSMPQLVDMSPFSFPGDDDRRVFVGRKETSLLLVELETGRVKATINSECPWDPFEDVLESSASDLDLDELDGTIPPRSPSRLTEVFIGRTDYHITIHTRPQLHGTSSVKPPVQNLSFSVYGPNNQDNGLQSLYRHTADDAYIQSLPNGKIISFKSADSELPHAGTMPQMNLLWAHAFPNTIVAVFDVFKAPNRQHPFVLLQPRPRLQDILPNVDLQAAARENRLPYLDAAYVGLVEETGSLYAMSPDRYPLVVFGDSQYDYGVGRTIDAPPGSVLLDAGFDPGRDLPLDMDSVTRRAKARRLRKMCTAGSTDRRCLTGVRRLESSSRSRLSRLLDGAPSAPLQPYYNSNAQDAGDGGRDGGAAALPESGGNASLAPPPDWRPDSRPSVGYPFGFDMSTLAPLVVSLLGIVFLVGFVWGSLGKRLGRRMPAPSPGSGAENVEVTSHTELSSALDLKATLKDGGEKATEPEETANSGSVTPLPSHDVDPLDVNVAPVILPLVVETPDDVADADDSEREGDAAATPGKRKGFRRKRGKKKKVAAISIQDGEQAKEAEAGKAAGGGGDAQGDVPDALDVPPSAIVMTRPTTPVPGVSSLVVSDTVLGFGSHGTVVFKGSLQGRAVAVKRLLLDFVTLASREVNVLQESDDHPNVIRYYYQESQANFLYIALELCPASLADVIERPDEFRDIVVAFDPKRALRQITSGLRHLHALKIVHRDIKPQNILVSHAKKGVGEGAGHRMLISDFGLCRKLDVDQSSFLPTAHGAMAAGTVGWRAPEILRGEVKLDESTGDDSQSSRGSVETIHGGTPTGKPTRLTKSVDIFALGCLYYYVLTNGSHPFGDRFEREGNILKNAKTLDGLERFGEEGSEGTDLISRMLSPEACDRPDTSTCLVHPYFWDPGKRLTFLQDASDRFEVMCRDPRDANLISLERGAFNVVGNDWRARLDKSVNDNLGKFRKYDGRSVQDLLRALRNKKHHYQDLPEGVKRLVGSMPAGFLTYFTRRFPGLLLHVHAVIDDCPLRHESMFRAYFELSD
ncbi:hypothetical protein B0H21DRAFT_311206 [Amylocystis lapponica]|nr:hypothetical protein B0H21DRAFT_311206 [Amylocystis lapponica]